MQGVEKMPERWKSSRRKGCILLRHPYAFQSMCFMSPLKTEAESAWPAPAQPSLHFKTQWSLLTLGPVVGMCYIGSDEKQKFVGCGSFHSEVDV